MPKTVHVHTFQIETSADAQEVMAGLEAIDKFDDVLLLDDPLAYIRSLPTSDLQIIARELRGIIDRRQERALSVGDRVKFRRRNGQWIEGTIKKINRKTVILHKTSDHSIGGWKVSLSMLEPVDE